MDKNTGQSAQVSREDFMKAVKQNKNKNKVLDFGEFGMFTVRPLTGNEQLNISVEEMEGIHEDDIEAMNRAKNRIARRMIADSVVDAPTKDPDEIGMLPAELYNQLAEAQKELSTLTKHERKN